MRSLTPLWVMAMRDLRARIRDRSVIVLGVLAPLALSLVFSMTTSGPSTDRIPVGRVAPSNGATPLVPPADDVLAQLAKQKLFRVRDYSSARDAKHAISKQKIHAAMRVQPPARAGAGVGAPEPARIDVWFDPDETVAQKILEGAARATAIRIDSVTRAVTALTVLRGRGASGIPDAQVARDVSQLPSRVTLDERRVPGLSTKGTVAAGMASFFLFFAVQVGLLGLLQERREGTLARLLASPTPPWQILGSKVLTSWIIGVISLVSLMVGMRVLMGVHWGNPLGLAILVAAGSLAATSTITLVVGVTRTPDAASVAQSMIALVLGLLGGSFFSMARSGGLAAHLTQLTPHYWFGEGLTRLAGGAAWTNALAPAGWLLVFAAVVGIPGLVLARRAVRP